jgi:hypothetical protein
MSRGMKVMEGNEVEMRGRATALGVPVPTPASDSAAWRAGLEAQVRTTRKRASLRSTGPFTDKVRLCALSLSCV